MSFKAVFHWRYVLLAMAWKHASRSIQAPYTPYDQRDFYTAGVLVLYVTPTVILVMLFYGPCKMPGHLQQLWNERVLALETAHLKGAIGTERF